MFFCVVVFCVVCFFWVFRNFVVFFLQYIDTVGWVFWPVLVETLNTAQSTNGRQLHYVPLCMDQLVPTVTHFMISLSYRRGSVNEDTRHGDSVCLLCHAVPTQKYPSIVVMVCFLVAGSVFGTIMSGLWHCHFSLHPIVPSQVAPVSDEPRCLSGWCFRRPSLSTSLSSFISYTLPVSPRTDSVQACRSGLRMLPWLINSSSRWTSALHHAYDQCRHHHNLSTIHDYQL